MSNTAKETTYQPTLVGHSINPDGTRLQHRYYTDRPNDTHVVYYATQLRADGTPWWVYSTRTTDPNITMAKWLEYSKNGETPMFKFVEIVWEEEWANL